MESVLDLDLDPDFRMLPRASSSEVRLGPAPGTAVQTRARTKTGGRIAGDVGDVYHSRRARFYWCQRENVRS